MERKRCPYCGEEIAASAKKCRFCGEWLEVTNMSEIVEIKSNKPRLPKTTESAQASDINNQRGDSSENSSGVVDDNPQGFFKAYFWDSLIQNYSSFSGVTSRKEFWLTYVALSFISLGILGLCFIIIGFGGMGGLWIGTILSSLACLFLGSSDISSDTAIV